MPRAGFCRRAGRIIPPAGALLAFAVFLLVLRVWNGPCGYDVYYYALQIKALTLHGELLFFDFSLVYYALYLVNCLTKNPVLSVQLLSSLSMAVICYCLLAISLRRGFSWYKVSVASLAVFNPASFNLLLEFTKNSFALALFFLSFLLLGRPARRKAGVPVSGAGIFFHSLLPPRDGKTFFGALAGLGAVCSHRIILVLGALFFLHRAAAGWWKTRQPPVPDSGMSAAKVRRKIPALLLAAGGGILLILALVFQGKFFAGRMPPLDIQAPLQRLLQLGGRRLWIGERIFYPLLELSLFFLIPWTLLQKRRPFGSASLFGALAWLFVFPFLRFSWDGLAFRLLIMAPLFAAPWLMAPGRERRPRKNRPGFPAGPGSLFRTIVPGAAALLFFAGSVFFIAGALGGIIVSKGPDYSRYRRDLGSLENLAAGRRIIAHRGLAGFLWFEKGIRSENFIPPAEEAGRYLRLVFFFAPEIFESYRRDGDPPPHVLDGTYTLVEEYIWQRFYRDRQDLDFLKSELNPYLPRPPSGFSINEKIAALMSPASGEGP